MLKKLLLSTSLILALESPQLLANRDGCEKIGDKCTCNNTKWNGECSMGDGSDGNNDLGCGCPNPNSAEGDEYGYRYEDDE